MISAARIVARAGPSRCVWRLARNCYRAAADEPRSLTGFQHFPERTVMTEPIETRGHGHDELLAVDTNNDGNADIRAIDTDGDGKADLFTIDSDGDGKVNVTMVDLDEDGVMDKTVYGE
jgi:hypothetical protein